MVKNINKKLQGVIYNKILLMLYVITLWESDDCNKRLTYYYNLVAGIIIKEYAKCLPCDSNIAIPRVKGWRIGVPQMLVFTEQVKVINTLRSILRRSRK